MFRDVSGTWVCSVEAAEQITPYDVEDMKRVLESQKEMTNNITMQNAQLVMENSERT